MNSVLANFVRTLILIGIGLFNCFTHHKPLHCKRARVTLTTLNFSSSAFVARRACATFSPLNFIIYTKIMSPPPSPNAKLERSYTLHKDREKLEQLKSGLQSEAAQGNIDVVLERLLKLDAKVHPRDVPAVYKRALLRFHPDRHVGKPIAKRASYEERLVRSLLNVLEHFSRT